MKVFIVVGPYSVITIIFPSCRATNNHLVFNTIPINPLCKSINYDIDTIYKVKL
jgi:hypothetical protein